jgi:signal transduction histidine kinase
VKRLVRVWAAALLWLACSLVQAGACDAPASVTRAQRIVAGAGALDGSTGVAIPDSVARALRNERVHISYLIDTSACAGAPAAALWLFRVGAPYRISADGQPLALLNNHALLSPGLVGSDFPMALQDVHNGRMPALFALPPGARQVTVDLLTLPYFPSGITRSLMGPTHLMLLVQAEASERVNAYIGQAAVVLLLLGLIALLLWLARRDNPSLLWLAVACALWGLRGLLYFGHRVYGEPMAFEQYNSLNVLLTSAALTAAVLHLLGGLRRAEGRALLWGTCACVAVYAASAAAQTGAVAVRALCLGASFLMVGWLLWRVWRGRTGWRRWHLAILATGLGVLLACGVHDVLLLTGRMAPDAPSYLFWGFVFLLTGMAAVSGHYVVLTLSRAERSNEELERRVAAKSGELERSYTQLRNTEIASAREAARVHERERLLREMHDGLGAQLMTALRGVERGALSREQLAQSLQDGLDELRLLMDSTDTSHYLPAALAAWRNRWDARLAAAGVLLEWQMDDSLEQVNLGSEAALHVMRILQEATTNVVKHSRAQRMTLRAGVFSGLQGERLLQIDIADDGAGLSAEAARSGARGLKNMAYRAGQIGAQLEVVNRAPPATGCLVRLALPMAD